MNTTIDDIIHRLAEDIYIDYSSKYSTLQVDKIKNIIYKFYIPEKHINNERKYVSINNNIDYSKGNIIYSNELKYILFNKLNLTNNSLDIHQPACNINNILYDNSDYSSTIMSPKYNTYISLIDNQPDIYLSVTKFIDFLYLYEGAINKQLSTINYKL
jgi:hypothetical protein